MQKQQHTHRSTGAVAFEHHVRVFRRRRYGELLVLWATASIVTLVVLLAACGGAVETPGEPLRLLRETMPQAYVGEPYQATLRAAGGLRPFTFTLSDGELPPGVELSAGALIGTPTATGTYSFTVTVSDASLNTTFEEYVVRVVEVPPPSITFNVPQTDIQRPTTLRAVVTGRDVRALRTVVLWNPDAFELVDGSFSSGTGFAALTESEPGSLQVDLAALGAPIQGERQVFSFALAPTGATRLDDASGDGAAGGASPVLAVRTRTEFIAAGRHFWWEAAEGAPGALPAETQQDTAPEPVDDDAAPDGEPGEGPDEGADS